MLFVLGHFDRGKRLFGQELNSVSQIQRKYKNYHRYRVVIGKRTGECSYLSQFHWKVDVVVFLGREDAASLGVGHSGCAGQQIGGYRGG